LAAWSAIQSGIISYVLKLEQRFRQAYAVELSNEGIKLLAVGLIWILGFTTALAGMTSVALGALVAAFLATRLLGQRFAKGVIPKQRKDHHSSRVLLGQIMPILPGTIHFTLQGPLIAWLAAYYGSVMNVAEVGALGRIGALIGVISGFTGTVFVPRLLAISDEALFLKRYLHWWLVMLTFGGIMMLAVLAFPEVLLYLLGGSYSGLHTELVISAATAVIATWGAFSWHINRARGWVKYQPYRLPVILAGQIPMVIALDFATTRDVLLFSLGSMSLDVLFQTLISVFGFLTQQKLMNQTSHA
jgi:branched-subunit amino acid transport protein